MSTTADIRLTVTHESRTAFSILDQVILWGLIRYLDSEVPAVKSGARLPHGSAVRTMGFIRSGHRPTRALVLSWKRGERSSSGRAKKVLAISFALVAGGTTVLASLDHNPWVKVFLVRSSIYLDRVLDWDRLN